MGLTAALESASWLRHVRVNPRDQAEAMAAAHRRQPSGARTPSAWELVEVLPRGRELATDGYGARMNRRSSKPHQRCWK
jgi:hypothetical protein